MRLGIMNVVLFSACFVSFLWGMAGGFFRVLSGVPTGTRVIQVLGTVFALVHLAMLVRSVHSDTATGLVAAALYIASLALFWASIAVNWRLPLTLAFSDDPPEHLVTAGPYRFIRHPFYCSYILAWVAGVIASREPWLVTTVVIMTTIYLRAAALEEAKFSHGAFRSAYAAYRDRTGALVPKIR